MLLENYFWNVSNGIIHVTDLFPSKLQSLHSVYRGDRGNILLFKCFNKGKDFLEQITVTELQLQTK